MIPYSVRRTTMNVGDLAVHIAPNGILGSTIENLVYVEEHKKDTEQFMVYNLRQGTRYFLPDNLVVDVIEDNRPVVGYK